MRLVLIILLTLTLNYGTSQKLNVKYRTAIDSGQRVHYVVFTDKTTCKLNFPITNHADAMASGMYKQKRDFDLSYKIRVDTIVFSITNVDTANLVLKRLLDSRLIIKANKTIYDLVSGYTYVDERLIDDKHTIYVLDGEFFKQKTAKTNGYGLILKDYKTNSRLKRKIKQIDMNKYVVNSVRGKAAFNKYGLIGMNGVIEINQKK